MVIIFATSSPSGPTMALIFFPCNIPMQALLFSFLLNNTPHSGACNFSPSLAAFVFPTINLHHASPCYLSASLVVTYNGPCTSRFTRG